MKKISLLITLIILPVTIIGQTWVTRYNGPGSDVDRAKGIVVDGSSNVYVTGSSFGSNTYTDYATIKYNAAGVEQWVRRYNGPASMYDEGQAITFDGNYLYVTGGSMDPNLYTDFVTIKYNTAGDQQWSVRYNGTDNFDDYPNAIGVDPAGNVYVVGYTSGTTTGWNFVTVKYNAAGAEQWVRRYITSDEDYAVAVRIDPSGNVYVTGNSGDPYFMTWDYVTIKYGPAGESLWLKRYNGPADSHDEVRAMAIDANGNVYVTGGSVGSGSSWDCTTIKYTPSGTEEWVRRYNGPANLADWGNAITVDGSGNIYVTGGSAVTGSDWDFITIKYNSAGVEQWVRRYNGPANDFDEAQAIATDGNNIYVTGKSTASNLHTDYVTIKYNTNGDSLWVKRYNGPANDDDNPLAITVDQSGYLYVTGESKGSGTEFDYATIKYPVTGIEDEYSKKSILFGESIQILPNPFRHSTTIQYQLSNPGYVSLKIYNAVGQMIQTLVNEHKGPGIHQTNFYPLRLTNGVYFAELDIYPDDRSTTKQSLKRKLLLIEE